MARIIINGIFYNSNLTGIERFAHEIVRQLDKICSADEVLLVLPANVSQPVPDFQNIKVKKLPKTPGRKQFNNVKLDIFLFFHRGICIDFTNHIPLVGTSIVFLHDIYCRVCPDDFYTSQDRRLRNRTCKMYSRIARRAKVVCTVSEYSKQQIMKYYFVPEQRIQVIYNGADHIKDILEDRGIFEKYPQLQKGKFFFTLGSLSVRKNLKWILNHAKLFPNEYFVISGATLSSVIPPELENIRSLNNILCMGYLSDGEVKALMKDCRAFIFPSFFEGFGIPPLEALACGTPAIVSTATCLPEIYEDCVYYIDPNNPSIDLNSLLEGEVAAPDKLFDRYSYQKSAKKLYDLVTQMGACL